MTDSLAQLDSRLARIPPSAAVTSVEVVDGHPRRRRLGVAGRFVTELDDLQVDRLAIAQGTPWTETLAAAVRDAVGQELTHAAAVRLLARRGLSRRELTDRLVADGCEATVAAVVADRLGNAGYLNDDQLAESICRQVRRRGPAGPRLLEERLRRRKVDTGAARTAVQRSVGELDLVEEAMRLGRRRLAGMTNIPRPAAIRRIAGALTRRGFDEETVSDALRRLGLDPDFPEEGIK